MIPRPRLCFVGPMLGRRSGWVPSQGELLADRFAQEGWVVRETSTQPNRLLRLVDTVSCLLRWRKSVDIVVLSVFSGPAFLMADVTSLVTRWLRLPTVMVLRGGSLPEFEQAHSRWVNRVTRRATSVVAPSSFLAGRAFATAGDVSIIPNVVDLDAIPHRTRTCAAPRLLWMRTFDPLYNPRLAVRALALVRESHPEATLTMAGQDKAAHADEVKSEVHGLGLDDVVHFAGFLDTAAKGRNFAGHDVYLHTNRVDNTPVSVLEAAAAGLPIVATQVGGIPHLLDQDRNALLVPSDDPEAMAQAICRVLTDDALAETLSRGGRELAQQSSWPRIRELWERRFEAVLEP